MRCVVCLCVFCLVCLCVWLVVYRAMSYGVLAGSYDCGVCWLFVCLRVVGELVCDAVWSVAHVWVLFVFVHVVVYACSVCD